MRRVEETFARLRSEGRGGLAPFVVAGRPSLERTAELLRTIQDAGADMIEVGIPFSDPIADGPVIAAAMHRAIEAGVTTRHALDALRLAREPISIPLIGMASVSILHRFGPAKFAKMAADAGLDGLILPDAPLEEADVFALPARDAGLTASLLVAPSTPPARAARIAAASDGFVYVVARAGVTGASTGAPDVRERIAQLREATDLPLAVGFGVSTPEHVRAVLDAGANAAIVGSALVRRIEEAGAGGVEAARELVGELRRGAG